MSIEKYLTYTEIDPLGVVTTTTNKIAWNNLQNDTNTISYLDKDIDHFNDDFVHYMECELTSIVTANYPVVWMIANSIGNGITIKAAGDSIMIYWLGDATPQLRLLESDGGALVFDDSISLNLNQLYYLTIERDYDLGANGQTLCKIYSDEAKTNIVDTLTINLQVQRQYRYIYILSNWDIGAPAQTSIGYNQNLNLNEIIYSRNIGFPFYNKMLGLPTIIKRNGE